MTVPSDRWEIVRKDGSVQDVTNLVRLVRDKITGHPITEFDPEVVLYNGDTLRRRPEPDRSVPVTVPSDRKEAETALLTQLRESAEAEGNEYDSLVEIHAADLLAVLAVVERYETLREASNRARLLLGEHITSDSEREIATRHEVVEAYFVLRDALAALAGTEESQ